MDTKKCSECLKTKPLEMFQKTQISGRTCQKCRECMRFARGHNPKNSKELQAALDYDRKIKNLSSQFYGFVERMKGVKNGASV